jgi:hypothetical protein
MTGAAACRRGATASGLRARMRMRLRSACLGLLALAASTVTLALDTGSRAQLDQRMRLASRLIADAPTVQRIGASGDAQALAHFDEGRVHHALAEELLAKGDLEGARREVDEALRHIGLARRMVPDAQARQAALRHRNENHSASLVRLVDAWRGSVAAGSGDEGELLSAIGLMETARRIGQQGRHDEAGALLDNARQIVLAGLGRQLNSRTLDYTQRASSPAEEFQIELARHRSLVDLLPVAMEQLKPGPDAAALMARYRASSQALLAQAMQQYESANPARALDHLRDASAQLQLALGAAGLRTPPPTTNPP